MAFVEDFSAFFSTAEFAVTATLDGVPVNGIFDNGFAQAFDGIATAEPSFLLPSAAAASVTQSSVLVVGSVTYRVRIPRHDGTGLCNLLLEKQ